MKTKLMIFLLTAVFVLPMLTSLFNLEAGRRRASVVVITTYNAPGTSVVISPN